MRSGLEYLTECQFQNFRSPLRYSLIYSQSWVNFPLLCRPENKAELQWSISSRLIFTISFGLSGSVNPYLLGLLARLALRPTQGPISRVLLLMFQRDPSLRMVEIWIPKDPKVLGRLMPLPKSTGLLILALEAVICVCWNSRHRLGTRPMIPHCGVLILLLKRDQVIAILVYTHNMKRTHEDATRLDGFRELDVFETE